MRWKIILLGAIAMAGCNEIQHDSVDIALPPYLLEVSGLAAAGPNSVFAHDDEHAIVHEINVETGEIIRSFALGDPTIAGDFEGIATAKGKLYLVTSDGLIYAFNAGEDRTRVTYRTHDTGIGPRCEIEGLSRAPGGDHLLILCKRLRRGEDVHRLEIYRWELGTEHAPQDPWIEIALDSFLNRQEQAEFGPTGLEWDEEHGRFLIVSARNRLLIDLSLDGTVLSKRRLDGKRHQRVEGIAILEGCRLALADEGNVTSRARLAVYPCQLDSASN